MEAKEVKEVEEVKEAEEAKEAEEVKEAEEAKEAEEVKEAEEAKDAEEVKEVGDGDEGKETRTIRQGPIRSYTDLLVYKQAYRLALEVSRLTRDFPRHEQYEIGRQVRSSSRSVAANIVEGWAKRQSAAEFRRHLQLAIGECEETKFWLDLAGDEACTPKDGSERLKVEYSQLGMMLYKLWREWRKLQ